MQGYTAEQHECEEVIINHQELSSAAHVQPMVIMRHGAGQHTQICCEVR
jgi:hypothetical protein